MSGNRHLFLCNGATLARAAAAWSHAHTESLQTGDDGNVRMELPDLARELGANVPDVFADLAEIAAFVYTADQAVKRSKTKTIDFGDKWLRTLRFEIAVRQPDFWNQPHVLHELTDTLGFLTEDTFEFRFSKHAKPASFDAFLGFGDTNPEGIERVIPFSGGIDSLVGATEEILQNNQKVVLISHKPATHVAARQRRLAEELQKRVANKLLAPLHLNLLVNKKGHLDNDHTQRSRTFLFASIAAVVSRIFGVNAIDFFENGIVSVNLPLCEQEVNARNTRTTHPQAMYRLSKFLTLVSDGPLSVRNRYLHMTKQDVVERLKQLGHPDLLGISTSCSHTRGLTHAQSHCGYCSQCLSRRVATIGAGLEAHDLASLYKIDPLLGDRTTTPQRTLAERFVGSARAIEKMADFREFQQTYASDLARVSPYLPGRNLDAIASLFDLHHRHARQVGDVMTTLMSRHAEPYRREELSKTSTLWFGFRLPQSNAGSNGQHSEGDAEAATQELLDQFSRLNARQRTILGKLLERDITDPELDLLPNQQQIADWLEVDSDTTLKNDLGSLVKTAFVDNGRHHGRRGGYFLTKRGKTVIELSRSRTSHD